MLGSHTDRSLFALAQEVAAPGRATGIALAFVDPDGRTEEVLRPGHLTFDETSLFELASVGKTMTATLLALLVLDGTVTLETTVGDVLGGGVGPVADVTFEELATHTSGLPTVAMKLGLRQLLRARDPYRSYDAAAMRHELATTPLSGRGTASYSNTGFDLLGHCLETVAGEPFGPLLTRRVLHPAGMATARCQPCADDGLAPARGGLLLGGRRWHAPLAGSGGVDGTLGDAAAWARANLLPASTPLEDAVRLAHATRREWDGPGDRIGLAWRVQRRGTFHGGGSGRYVTFLAFHPEVGALVGIENQGPHLRGDPTHTAQLNRWWLDRVDEVLGTEASSAGDQ